MAVVVDVVKFQITRTNNQHQIRLLGAARLKTAILGRTYARLYPRIYKHLKSKRISGTPKENVIHLVDFGLAKTYVDIRLANNAMQCMNFP